MIFKNLLRLDFLWGWAEIEKSYELFLSKILT